VASVDLHQRVPPPLRSGLVLTRATAAQIRERSSGPITRPIWVAGDPELRRGGLFDPDIFGPGWADPAPEINRERVEGNVDTFVRDVGREVYGHIELPVPVPHPLGGEPLAVIAVIPPSLRPLVYLHHARYSASDLNDLYQRVIEIAGKLRRIKTLDPELVARGAPDLARAIEHLFLNDSAEPARTATGRPMTALVHHLQISGRAAVRALSWGLGYIATWSAGFGPGSTGSSPTTTSS
jgi:DNA-directed RNA polymerase beta' subunit